MMSYDPNRHHRRSIRLPGYDYARVGAYFITICTHGRARLFGQVARGAMVLSELGQIAEDEWRRAPALRPNVALDAFVVMPDHMHAVVVIERQTSDCAGRPTAFHSPSQTVGAIVRGYKAAVTRRINDARGVAPSPLWLRNYYEHIVRDDADLDRIRRYIANNPARWEERRRGR